VTHFSVAHVLELPLQERIQRVKLIWESIAAVPEAGYSWDQVKAQRKHGTFVTVARQR
jgi:hypothetical protein